MISRDRARLKRFEEVKTFLRGEADALLAQLPHRFLVKDGVVIEHPSGTSPVVLLADSRRTTWAVRRDEMLAIVSGWSTTKED